MTYLFFITSTFLLTIPLMFLVDFVFNILQLPFALINRFAVYIVFAFKTYIVCLYYVLLIDYGIMKYDLLALPLVIAFSIILLYMMNMAVGSGSRDNDNSATVVLGIFSYLTVPLIFILYYFNIRYFDNQLGWIIKLFDQILSFSPILNFFLTIIGTSILLIIFGLFSLGILMRIKRNRYQKNMDNNYINEDINETTIDNSKLYNTKEASMILGVSVNTVRRYFRDEMIAEKIGGVWYVSGEELQSFIDTK